MFTNFFICILLLGIVSNLLN
uniref:NADH dehydrogenase subunit 1 n=1 Tax=Heterorhabditis bacteriophora TaxID=37862 RepID=A0A1I7WYX5_HETBA